MVGFQKKYDWHFHKRAEGRVKENLYLFSCIINASHKPKSSSPAPSLSASLNFLRVVIIVEQK